jgi:hypothetical protein
MERRFGFNARQTILTFVLFPISTAVVTGAAATVLDPSLSQPPKSLSDLAFMIGDWRCAVTEAGKPATHSSVKFEWIYDKNVLKETVVSPAYSGQFMTTIDKKSNTFKGVAVGNDGSYVVWESPGLKDNKSSEVGYVFSNGQLIPVSRSDFELKSNSHYVIRDFRADTATGKGAPTDTEDCTKVAQTKGSVANT